MWSQGNGLVVLGCACTCSDVALHAVRFSTLVCGAGVYLYLFRCCVAVRFSTLVCGAGVRLYLFRCCIAVRFSTLVCGAGVWCYCGVCGVCCYLACSYKV